MTRALLLMAVLLMAVLGPACARDPAPDRMPLPGNAGRGLGLVRQLDCGACHVIPGIREARGRTGPSLEGFARRIYIAGRLPNQPESLVRFLRDPPAHAPHTLMPAQGLDEAGAQDVAAYLYSLR
jgi:cytochrome c2